MNHKEIRIFEDEIIITMNGHWRTFQVRHWKATAFGGGKLPRSGEAKRPRPTPPGQAKQSPYLLQREIASLPEPALSATKGSPPRREGRLAMKLGNSYFNALLKEDRASRILDYQICP
jgi:hypothetical protein